MASSATPEAIAYILIKKIGIKQTVLTTAKSLHTNGGISLNLGLANTTLGGGLRAYQKGTKLTKVTMNI